MHIAVFSEREKDRLQQLIFPAGSASVGSETITDIRKLGLD